MKTFAMASVISWRKSLSFSLPEPAAAMANAPRVEKGDMDTR